MAIFLLGLTGLNHRLDVNKVQVNAAAVKKFLALFLTFFWKGRGFFDGQGYPQPAIMKV